MHCRCGTIREKGRDLTQSYDITPYTHRKIQKATWQHKKRHQNFGYTTIVDRLRTVSGSNSSHPTGVVKHKVPGQGDHLWSSVNSSTGFTPHREVAK